MNMIKKHIFCFLSISKCEETLGILNILQFSWQCLRYILREESSLYIRSFLILYTVPLIKNICRLKYSTMSLISSLKIFENNTISSTLSWIKYQSRLYKLFTIQERINYFDKVRRNVRFCSKIHWLMWQIHICVPQKLTMIPFYLDKNLKQKTAFSIICSHNQICKQVTHELRAKSNLVMCLFIER